MDYEEREERLYILRMYKFIFNIVSVAFPRDLQKEYNKFSYNESSYFTDSITRAVLILMNEKYDNIEEIPDIGSDDFDRIAKELTFNYNPVDFLKFCSWFGMKAAYDRVGENYNSYQTLWTTLENIFQRGRERGGFDLDTWDILEKVATRIVYEDDIKSRRLPNFDPNAELNLTEEKAFVLRLMQHIFQLYSKDLPSYFKDDLRVLDEENYHLTEEVQKALSCLIKIMIVPESKLGDVGLRNYYYAMSFDPFKIREFLEYCVCFSRKALLDYYKYWQAYTPFHIFECCVKILKGVRELGVPTPWGKIQDVAVDILEEMEDRLEHERLKQQLSQDLMNKQKREIDDMDKLELSKINNEKSGDIDKPGQLKKWEAVKMRKLAEAKKPDSVEMNEPSVKKNVESVEMDEPVEEKNLESVEMDELVEENNLKSVEMDESGENKKRKLDNMDKPDENKKLECLEWDKPGQIKKLKSNGTT